MDIINSGLTALLATWFCIWLLRPLAIRVGLVDSPGGRKTHHSDVPLIGGIAMFFGFCFALLAMHVSLLAYRGLFAGASLLMLIGVVDDFHELGSKTRLLGQILATLFMVTWGEHIVVNLGDLFFLGNVNLGLWAFPVTVIAVIGYINSMNMLDGQDGLAGGIAFTQALLLIYLSQTSGRNHDAQILIILAIILAVFLSFNMQLPWRRHASIFMGDAGITFVAFVIAWFGVDLSQANIMLIKPMTILWVLAFPLFDLMNVTIYRLRLGKSPFQAGRDHIHHVLHVKGIDASLSTLILCVWSTILGVIGVAFNYFNIAEAWQFYSWVAMLGMYLLFVKIVRD